MPGGILLWGPPGTGKTLIAEAVAGETHNPFVFVDPGAFINMFMGVGILKVKSLFRKLRRLALRYGGVVVFFDEADSLGNSVERSPRDGCSDPNSSAAPWSADGCNACAYSDPATMAHVAASTGSLTLGGRGSGAAEDDGNGHGHGRRVLGTLQSLLSELSGLNKPRGLDEPGRVEAPSGSSRSRRPSTGSS